MNKIGTDSELIGLLREAISKGVSLRFAVKGASMSPFIRDGDMVTITPLSAPTVGLGVTVAYAAGAGSALVIHRVIARKPGGYITKGDNAGVADGFIPARDILGFVSAVQRGGRRVSLGLGIERIAAAALNKANLFPVFFRIKRLVFARVPK